MQIKRLPRPALRPFVKLLWSVDQSDLRRPLPGAIEHVLPTGDMHLVFRLTDHPLQLIGPGNSGGREFGRAVVGGVRSSYYIRDVSHPASSVGAVLRPGVAGALLGAHAEEFAQHHTCLEDHWGGAVGDIHERLLETGDPRRRIELLEAEIARRLPATSRLHPAVSYAVAELDASGRVDAVVSACGYSHRHFIAMFRRAVGLTPKAYSRVRRFQQGLREMHRIPSAPLASIALESGYSDQAHMTRDFLDFAGVTPSTYRKIAPVRPNHIQSMRAS